MKIVHIAPYGPNRCGLYEAARDMAKADILSGHQVHFVDKGFTRQNGQEYSPIGSTDNRGDFKLMTTDPKVIDFADIIIDHSGIPDHWISKNQTPIICMVHGRPLASFRLEYFNNKTAYTFDAEIAKWPRVKKMVYFWPEFKPNWEFIFPEEKQVVLDFPPIDEGRFNPNGTKHIIEDKHKGEFNILICDTWREDIDIFEIFNGAIQTAKDLKGKKVKFHIYSIETPIKPCWDLLFQELYKFEAAGELCGRMTNMEQVYRGMDAVLTPHRIVTRVIGEALSCGTPVIASKGCKVTPFTCNPHDPYSVSKTIKQFINSNQNENKENALLESKKFNLENYSKVMNPIYDEIMKGK